MVNASKGFVIVSVAKSELEEFVRLTGGIVIQWYNLGNYKGIEEIEKILISSTCGTFRILCYIFNSEVIFPIANRFVIIQPNESQVVTTDLQSLRDFIESKVSTTVQTEQEFATLILDGIRLHFQQYKKKVNPTSSNFLAAEQSTHVNENINLTSLNLATQNAGYTKPLANVDIKPANCLYSTFDYLDKESSANYGSSIPSKLPCQTSFSLDDKDKVHQLSFSKLTNNKPPSGDLKGEYLKKVNDEGKK